MDLCRCGSVAIRSSGDVHTLSVADRRQRQQPALHCHLLPSHLQSEPCQEPIARYLRFLHLLPNLLLTHIRLHRRFLQKKLICIGSTNQRRYCVSSEFRSDLDHQLHLVGRLLLQSDALILDDRAQFDRVVIQLAVHSALHQTRKQQVSKTRRRIYCPNWSKTKRTKLSDRLERFLVLRLKIVGQAHGSHQIALLVVKPHAETRPKLP